MVAIPTVTLPKVNSTYFQKTSGWQKMMESVANSVLGPNSVKVGFPLGTNENIMLRAVVNEFGAVIPVTKAMQGFFWSRGAHIAADVVVIPERPFLRNAVTANTVKWQQHLRMGAAAIAQGVTDTRTVLEMIGIEAVADIQRSIDDMNDPPNAPLTIEWKGSSKPLVDTGQMRASVTYVVLFTDESTPLTVAG